MESQKQAATTAPLERMVLLSVVALVVVACSFTLGRLSVTTEPDFDQQFRIGDKVLITEGFYTGVHAYINDRRWDGERWRYELLGDPSQSVAISHHDNAFIARQFRIREKQ